MSGNTIIRAWCLSGGVSCCVDTEISTPHPEFWSKRISRQTFSENIRVDARLRDSGIQYSGTYGNDHSSEVLGE